MAKSLVDGFLANELLLCSKCGDSLVTWKEIEAETCSECKSCKHCDVQDTSYKGYCSRECYKYDNV